MHKYTVDLVQNFLIYLADFFINCTSQHLGYVVDNTCA